MRTRTTARRSIALMATTALMSGGLATGMLAAPAYAADAVVQSFLPTQWDNRSTVRLIVTGSGFMNADPTGFTRDSVVMTPVVLDSPHEIAPFSVTANQSTSSTTLVADIPLAMAPTGDYAVRVEHFDGTPSNTPAQRFSVYGYGAANAIGSSFGPDPTGEFPLDLDCDVITSCFPRGAGSLDIQGSNIAIGAKVRFLRLNDSVDDKITFVQGNPNNSENNLGTQDADGADGTGYASNTLLQGNYSFAPDSGGLPGFTAGMHKLQIVNNDGDATGVTSMFAQPWFSSTAPLSPGGIGVGAKNVVVTLTGLGIRDGSALSIASGGTSSCAGVTVGPSTVSQPDGAGTFTKISAPVSMADCSTDNLNARAVTILGPDGARFGRGAIFNIVANPTFTALSSGYDVLGQGAHVGYGAQVVNITGSNFVGDAGDDPAKMTKFSFGDGVTVTTVHVLSPGTAQVRIDVDPLAAIGERVVTVTNPDGGSSSKAHPTLPSGDPDPTASAPLEITAGPKVSKVEPSSLQPSEPSKTVTVTGTFNTDDTYTVQVCNHLGTADCTPSSGITVANVATPNATTLTFSVSTNGAAPGLRDLVITDNADHGRDYCTGCMGVDSLTLSPPASGANTGSVTLNINLGSSVGDGTASSNAGATLTRLVDLPGQLPIAGTNVTPGAAGSHTATATFDLTGAAPGKYSLTVVKDKAVASSPTWSCTGCFAVTGAAITTTSIDRVPTDGTKDATTSGGQGASSIPLRIEGTEFTKGAQVLIADEKVTVHDVVVASPTLLTLQVDVAPDAAPGSKAVTVTSGDGTGPGTGSKTTNLTFVVTKAPVPSGAPSPASYAQGAGTADYTAANPAADKAAKITVSGEEFQPDATIALGPDITVLTHAVAQGAAGTGACPGPACIGHTPDTLTVTVAVAESATPGKRDLVVLNGDSGSGRLADAFTVLGGPQVSSVANDKGAPALVPDGAPHAITILGSGFSTADPNKAVPAVIPATGVTLSNIVVVNAGKITADVTVATDAVRGVRKVGVTNPADKGFGSLSPVYVATAPDAVTSLTLVPGARSLTANWNAPASNGSEIVGYKLTIRAPGAATATEVPVQAAPRTYTFGNLINGVTYTVGIAAVNGVGTGPSTTRTGIAGLASALSIKLVSTATTYGTPFVVSGKLTSNGVGVGGKTIIITFVPTVGSTIVRTVGTVASGTAKGTWSYKASLPYTTKIKAQLVPNDATYRPVTTGYVTETVRVRVLRTAPANLSKSGSTTTLKIAGNVAPNKKGKYAYLYRYTAGKKVLLQRVTISSTSTFLFSIKPGKGIYYLKVYVPATTGNAANYSNTFKLYRV